ncbi:unnamed protein product [Closterium sp. Naga37s-1]|nr:unnamed protein product [Closterium sp. Naga37s-1]
MTQAAKCGLSLAAAPTARAGSPTIAASGVPLAALPRGSSSAVRSVAAMSVGSSFKESWCGKAHLGCSDMRVVFQGSRSVASRSTRTAGKGLLVQASFMGVGAPEALVIGVVALLVFGPKGLAEMARGVGKTLKTFQPTIRELQEVSREFRDTLQSEIGIDDIRNPPPPPPTPVAAPPAVPPTLSAAAPAASPAAAPAATAASAAAPNVTIIPKEFSADDVAKVTEQQLAAAAALNTVTDDMKKGMGIVSWLVNSKWLLSRRLSLN